MISIVTGTLDRISMLPTLIKNTVDADDRIELILVDGGSKDGTCQYIKDVNHPRIKLIEVGERSPYPHYMNLGIRSATHDFICQWNDDVYLINTWQEVIDNLDTENDIFHFNWKYGTVEHTKHIQWLDPCHHENGWCMIDEVVNYGIYNRRVFEKCGLYNTSYKYYCCDGDMTRRAVLVGHCKQKLLYHIKVCAYLGPKKAIHYAEDNELYKKLTQMYTEGKLPPEGIEKL